MKIFLLVTITYPRINNVVKAIPPSKQLADAH